MLLPRQLRRTPSRLFKSATSSLIRDASLKSHDPSQLLPLYFAKRRRSTAREATSTGDANEQRAVHRRFDPVSRTVDTQNLELLFKKHPSKEGHVPRHTFRKHNVLSIFRDCVDRKVRSRYIPLSRNAAGKRKDEALKVHRARTANQADLKEPTRITITHSGDLKTNGYGMKSTYDARAASRRPANLKVKRRDLSVDTESASTKVAKQSKPKYAHKQQKGSRHLTNFSPALKVQRDATSLNGVEAEQAKVVTKDSRTCQQDASSDEMDMGQLEDMLDDITYAPSRTPVSARAVWSRSNARG